MKLTDCFRSNPFMRVAFFGMKGKVTSLIQLANALSGPVMVSTITPTSEIDFYEKKSIIIQTNTSRQGDFLSGKQIVGLYDRAKRLGLPLLFEISISDYSAILENPTRLPKWCATLVVEADNISDQQASEVSRLSQDMLFCGKRLIVISNGELIACYEKVAGIILAAGASRRFGQPKVIVNWRGKPMILHVVEQAIMSGLDPIIVVLGAVDQPIRSIIEHLPVQIIHTNKWLEGQSSSIHAGLSALELNSGGAIFLLADQPQVTERVIRGLVELHRKSHAPIIAPLINGQRGNPVFFDRSTFCELMTIQGDQGGRAIFSKYQIQWLEWLDESLLFDIDTVSDLIRLGD